MLRLQTPIRQLTNAFRKKTMIDETSVLSKLSFEETLLALLECSGSRCYRTYGEIDRIADSAFPNHRARKVGWETAEIMTRSVSLATPAEVNDNDFWRKLMEKSHQALQRGVLNSTKLTDIRSDDYHMKNR
jgi:hypothetical protein